MKYFKYFLSTPLSEEKQSFTYGQGRRCSGGEAGGGRLALDMWTSRDKGVLFCCCEGISIGHQWWHSPSHVVTKAYDCLSLYQQAPGLINIFTHPRFGCAGKVVPGFKFITALAVVISRMQSFSRQTGAGFSQKRSSSSKFTGGLHHMQCDSSPAGLRGTGRWPGFQESGSAKISRREASVKKKKRTKELLTVCVEGGRGPLAAA